MTVMIKKILLIESNTTDPYYNLALEENLLGLPSPGELIFFLWQNENTVVIGRNQNCLRECDVARLESDGGRLARRVSGGGAVYHDLGNLNFSFVTTKEDYDENAQTRVVLSAVKLLGICAERSGRNDLTVNGRKFSGNAYHRGRTCLRHGTLLINSDLDKLGVYLGTPGGKLETKGVRSVASKVVNLSELDPAIGIAETASALRSAARVEFDAPLINFDEAAIDRELLIKNREKFSSPEWIYGGAPNGDYRVCERFGWGEIEIFIKLNGGVVAECAVYSDALETAPAELLPAALIGKKLDGELPAAIGGALSQYGDICRDIQSLFAAGAAARG